MDPLSFGRLWPETLATARRHGELFSPIAGLLLFLPQLLFNWHVGDALPAELFKGERMPGDALALALLLLVSLIGQLSITFIAVNDGTAGLTVGEVLKRSLFLLVPALAASLIQGLSVGFGLVLLVLAGLWLLARLVVVMPVVATRTRDPLEALRESWRLTDGHALRIIGMLAILIFGFILLSLGINGLGAAIGVLSTVAAGQPAEGWGVGRWLFEVLAAGASAAIGVVYLCFLATLYRALAAAPRPLA